MTNKCSTCQYKKDIDGTYISCTIGNKVLSKKGNVFMLIADVMDVDLSMLTEGMVEGIDNAYMTGNFAWPVRFKEDLLKNCMLYYSRKEN